jgi:hypothetical protein
MMSKVQGYGGFRNQVAAVVPKGERRVLIVNLDSLLRISSILFFPYLAQRIEEDFRQKTLLRILLVDEATEHSANAGGQIDLFAAVEVLSSGEILYCPLGQ